MFKGIFGSKPAKAPEGYVPPSIHNLEATGVPDASRTTEQPKSDSSASAFGFISTEPEPAASPSSAFGFISSNDATAVPAVPFAQHSAAATSVNQSVSAASPDSSSSGFSFIQNGHPAATASGFSFMQDTTPAAVSGSAEVDPKIIEENMRVAGMKKVVKKRSMARKPGQAAHDDDEPPPSSTQKSTQPAVVDVAKASNSVVSSNPVVAPVMNDASSLSNEVRSENLHSKEEPAFAFMTAAPDSHARPFALPSSTSAASENGVNSLPSIQDDGDSDNSDGGGLDLDGMIIHEVTPVELAPPVHQPQLQHQTLPSGLQDWVEMRDDTSGKIYYQNNLTQVTSWDPPPGWLQAPRPAPAQHSSSLKQEPSPQQFVAPVSVSDVIQDAHQAAEAFDSFSSKILMGTSAASDCSSFVPASDSVRSAAANCLSLLDGLVSKCNLDISTLLDQRSDLSANIIKNLEVKLVTISSDIQIATQSEDFERAEALTAEEQLVTRSLSQRKAELDLLNGELLAAQSKIGRILSVKVQVSEALVRFATSCASSASTKGNLTVGEMDSQVEITLAKMNSKARQASALDESLQLEKQRLADDEKIVADKIYDMTRDGQEKLSRLKAAQSLVSQEIAELEKQLRMKIAEKTQIENDMQELNSSVDVVKQDFAPQFAAFRARQESHMLSNQQLSAIREEVQQKETELAHQRSAREAAKAALASVSSTLSKTASAAADLLAAQRSCVDSYAEEQREKAKEAEQEETERREMQSIDMHIQQSSSAFEKVSSSLLGLQAEVQGIVSEVLRIDIRVPELESQKKAAISAKKFKEAGLFSAESKDLLAKKEELLSRKEHLIAEEDVQKQEAHRLEASQTTLSVEKEKLSKVHDSQRLQRLIRRHKLRAGAQARAISTEDFAAADSLQKECSLLAEEIKSISSKLGVPMVDLQEHLQVLNPPASQSSSAEVEVDSVIFATETSNDHRQLEPAGVLTSSEQPFIQSESLDLGAFAVLGTADAAAKLQTLKELASKLDDQLDQLVSQEKFEEAEEYNHQLDDVRRQINALEAELQSRGLNLSESESQSSSSLDLSHQPSAAVEVCPSSLVDSADAATKLQTLKELASKLDDQLDQLVSQEKFEEAEEYNHQLDDVRRQINALEVEMQSRGLNLSESESQGSAAVQWEQDAQDRQSEKSGTSGFGRTLFSDSVPGDGRTIHSFCSGASTGSNDEDDRGSKDGAGTVYTIGSLYSQAHVEGGGEDAGSMWERTSATESRGGRESQGGDNDQEAVDDYDARGHHETDAKFSDVDSGGSYPSHSFMTIVSSGMDGDDHGGSQQQISTASGDILSSAQLAIEQAAAAVALSADVSAAPEESNSHQTSVGDLAESVFPFLSIDASSVPDIAASTSGEALVSQAPLEASADGGGSAFSFL